MSIEMNFLKFTDSVLSSMVRSAKGVPAVPVGMKLRGGNVQAVGGAQAAAALEAMPGLESMKTGQEIYDFWNQLTELATERAKTCTELYNEAAGQLVSLEDQKNTCYQKGDLLKNDLDRALAKRKGLESNIQSLRSEIENLQEVGRALEQRIRKLEKDKKIYNILRWFPIIGAVSEMVAAIDGTRRELSGKINTLEARKRDLRNLFAQLKTSAETLADLEIRISQNELEAKQLQAQIVSFQAQRDSAAKEMIAWKDREQYYLNMEQMMEYLVDTEADVKEFKEIIAENPPPFQLAA